MGYFFVESKSKGLYMVPQMSVTPSAALTMNGSDTLNPISLSPDRSAVSRSMTTFPNSSRMTHLGVMSVREAIVDVVGPLRVERGCRRCVQCVARVHQCQPRTVEIHLV